MYQQQREPGAQTGPNSTLPTGMQIGLGVSAGSTSASFTQGTLQNTGGDFDVAIKGRRLLQSADAGRKQRLHPRRQLRH